MGNAMRDEKSIAIQCNGTGQKKSLAKVDGRATSNEKDEEDTAG